MRKFHINLSLCISVVLLIFGLLIFIDSQNMRYWSGYGPGEGFVSTWTSGFLIVLSAISVITSSREEGVKLSEVFPKGTGLYNILFTFGGIVVFLLIVETVGFFVSSILMLSLMLSRGYKLHHAIMIAILISIICFYCFSVLLQVPIPVNSYGF